MASVRTGKRAPVPASTRIERALEHDLDGGGPVTAGGLALQAQVSRQAAHARLRKGVEAGVLRQEGKGPATHYVLANEQRWHRTLSTAGLAEDRVLDLVRRQLGALATLSPEASSAFDYAFTEIVNNAIDHAEAAQVDVRVGVDRKVVWFEITDAGVGIWAKLRRQLKFESDLEALQELSKGKRTTDPARHSGEGTFFTSKVADWFELDSAGLAWKVDTLRADAAFAEVPARRGTRVVFRLARNSARSPQSVFAEYTHDFRFDRTRTVVKLFELGTLFVSRSEARRLLRGLEAFREIVVDFAGVLQVGQGFCDEVFRVYPQAHPDVRVTWEHAVPAVEAMIRHVLRGRRLRGTEASLRPLVLNPSPPGSARSAQGATVSNSPYPRLRSRASMSLSARLFPE